MDDETVAALAAINRRFYDRYAAEFSATRQRAWRGWDRVVDHLATSLPTPGPLQVLDAGCGNGRFASYLAGRWPRPFDYLGLDSCAQLLELAGDRLAALPGRVSLVRVDLTRRDALEPVLGCGCFDLIVLFGVLHHLPGSATRHSLLRQLARHLAPSGLLAVSIWQRDQRRDFVRGVVPWQEYNRRQSQNRSRQEGRPDQRVAIDQLDDGDALLTWAGDAATPRYCHFPGPGEIDGWLEQTGLEIGDRFEADGASGRENRYLLLEQVTP